MNPARIPVGLALEEEILRLRTERNAVILAHYYQESEIQDLADFVGDSLALARAAQRTDAAWSRGQSRAPHTKHMDDPRTRQWHSSCAPAGSCAAAHADGLSAVGEFALLA